MSNSSPPATNEAEVEVVLSSQEPPRRRKRKIAPRRAVLAAAIFVSCTATGVVAFLANGRSAERNDAVDAAATAALGSSAREDGGSNDGIDLSSNSPVAPSPSQSSPNSPYSPTYGPTSGPTAGSDPVTFYAVGDVPYSDMEACLLPHELAKLSTSEAKFLVHLGDIQDGRSDSCPETLYEDVAAIFESSPLPTFFVIGDNEWLDCEGGAPANESLAHWEKHLLPFHERTDLNWSPLDASVTYHPDRPEMYSFLLGGVLFLGQGLPWPQPKNAPDPVEWLDYLVENADWTRRQFAANVDRMRAAVILAHASPEPYLEQLKDIADSYERVPILFLEDFHYFEAETFPNTPNLYRIALDDTVTPTSITADANATGGITGVFRYDRRCPCSTLHRPTTLLSHSSGDCEGACDANDLCAGENACGRDGATCR